MELRKLWEMLRRRKWLFIQSVLIITIVPLLVSFIIMPIYSVTAKVLIDIQALEPNFLSGVPSELSKFSYIDADNVISTFETIIESVPPNEKVIKSLNIKDKEGKTIHVKNFINPDFISLIQQGKGVTIEQDQDSEAFTVTGKSTSINEAVNIANSVMDSFIEFYNELLKQQISKVIATIEMQMKDTKEKLKEAEDMKVIYQVGAQIVDLSTQRTNLISQISNLETDKTTAQRTLKEDGIKLDSIKTALSKQPEFKLASITTQANNILDTYKSQLLTLEMSLAKSLVDLTSAHPDVKAIQNQIDSIKEAFKRETEKIYGSETTSRNSYYDTLVQNLSDTEIDVITQTARIKILEEQIRSKYKRLEGFADSDVQLNRLQREIDAQSTVYNTLLKELEWAKLASQLNVGNIKQLQRAEVIGDNLKKYKYFPNKKLILVVSAFLGIFFGFFMVVVVDHVDDSIKTYEEITAIINSPVVGRINFFKKGMISYTPFWDVLSNMPSEIRAISIISAEKSDGKSTVARYLAEVAAQKGYKTLLVDGNLRAPSLHNTLGVNNVKGFANWLVQNGSIGEFVIPTRISRLDIIPAGELTEDPLKYLEKDKLKEFKEAVLSSYDLLIIDTPAIDEINDGICISSGIGKALFIIALSKTSSASIKRSLAKFNEKNIDVIGVILNRDSCS